MPRLFVYGTLHPALAPESLRAHGGAIDAWVYVYARPPGAAPWLRDGRFSLARRDTLSRGGGGL